MSMATNGLKRKLQSGTISPPPIRRRVQSTTTQNAVSSFFTPTSKKSPQKVVWQERSPNDDTPATLLVGKYEPPNAVSKPAVSDQRSKVAAFDFDSTLIATSSGKKHASDAQDWRWWHSSVPGVLKRLHQENYLVVVVSNQGGITLKSNTKTPKANQSRLMAFKEKVASVFSQLEFPISIYTATEKDLYRKPCIGMWTELLDDHSLPGLVNLEESFFVGDAGGRLAEDGAPKDFSSSDRNLADNIGIKFLTPEEYFLKEAPRPFQRFEPSKYLEELAASSSQEQPGETSPPFIRHNPQDIVLFVGSPGAGKSSWYERYLGPLGYKRINQDTLKTRDKCLKVATEHIYGGLSVAIDNTNADPEVRSKWIELAKKLSIPIRCVHFLADPQVCKHNDAVRAMNSSMNPESRTILPSLAFTGFASHYHKPELSEGFQNIIKVPFKFEGSEEKRKVWSRYWT